MANSSAAGAAQKLEIDTGGGVTALLKTAVAAQRKGAMKTAEQIYRRAIQIDPLSADAFHNLAVLLFTQGRGEEGERAVRSALEIAPENGLYRRNYANYLLGLNRITEAARQAEKAALYDPEETSAWSTLAQCAARAGDSNAAFQAAQRALRLKPDNAEAINACGLALMHAGDFVAAEEAYQCALSHTPNSIIILTNLSNCLQVQGKFEKSLHFYRRALALNPQHSPAHFGIASSYLSTGRFREGWDSYEWRHHLLQSPKSVILNGIPMWDGKSAAGKRIIVRHEQGLGDMIQFIRHAPELARRGLTPLYSVPKALMRLFGCFAIPLQCVPAEKATYSVDCQTPLLSLPHLLGQTAPRDGAVPPYFTVPEKDVTAWRERLSRLAEDRGFSTTRLVGLNWAGRLRQINYHNRQIALDELMPALQAPEIAALPIFSVQKEPGREALHDHPLRHRLIDLGDEITDFYDTAAIMQALDLVVSCDSAPLHLAGALNIPAIGLLPHSTDWRWEAGGSQSPFYPSLRLLRQEQPGDWRAPIRELGGFFKWLARI